MKITGLVLWTLDNTLSVKFYKKLGFDVAESNERHSVVKLGDFEITLVSMRDEEEFHRDSLASDKGRGMYIYIHVEDTDAKYTELKESGILPYSEPRNWDWGNREFIIKDPDGYKLCFWAPSAK
jgi:uncharacterized glyoxalase superfamily protein PhnB